METVLRITLIQTELHWENIEKNILHFNSLIEKIEKSSTDLIVLPEMFSTGFTMSAAAMAESMNGKAMQWMKKIASEKNCVVTGSVIISEKTPSPLERAGGEAFFNRLIWMKPDGNFSFYNKRHLFSLAGEEKIYTAGEKKIFAEINGWKILPLICYDLRFPVWSRRAKQDDYDLLIYVANWPERRIHAWKQLLIARAIENQCYVVGLNRIGNDGNNVYHSGDSAVIDFKGEMISKTKPHEENIETVSLDLELLKQFRKNFPFGEDADDFKL